jgi:hypothetical protein
MAVKNAAQEPTSFKLAGSMSSDLTDDELEAALVETRKKWSLEAERRAERWLRD